MDIEQINHWIEEPLDARPEEIENRFFHSFENRRPEQIPYNQLRQINIPVDPANQLDDLVEEFGIEIPDEEAENITTVGSAVDYIEKVL